MPRPSQFKGTCHMLDKQIMAPVEKR
jgi:hypothetical protein